MCARGFAAKDFIWGGVKSISSPAAAKYSLDGDMGLCKKVFYGASRRIMF